MASETCAECTTVYAVGAEKCPQCGSSERAEKPGGAVLPSVTVACGNEACRYEARERRVHLRTAAPGVLELPRLACAGCGYEMPTVTPWPPVTESTESEDEDMPKITVHGGASNVYAEPEPVDETDEQEAGEDVSAGNSFETSSEKEPTSHEPNETETPLPVRATGSRSKKPATTKDSSAGSAGGGQAAGTSASDGETAR